MSYCDPGWMSQRPVQGSILGMGLFWRQSSPMTKTSLPKHHGGQTLQELQVFGIKVQGTSLRSCPSSEQGAQKHRHLRAPLHGQINLSSSQSRALPDLPLMALGEGSRRQKPLQNAHRSGTLFTLCHQPHHQHYPTLFEEDMGKHINIW